MRGRLSDQAFYHEINGKGAEPATEPSTWSLSRLIVEGWGEELALQCHYHELGGLVLSEDERKAKTRVANAEKRLKAIMQTLGIPSAAPTTTAG